MLLVLAVTVIGVQHAWAHPNPGGSNVDENANHMGHLIPDGFDGENPRYFALMHRTDTYSWETRDIEGVHDSETDASGSFDWPPETGNHYIIAPDSRLVGGGDGRIALADSAGVELVLHKGFRLEEDQSNFESHVINRDASDEEVAFTVVFKKAGTFRAALACDPPALIGGSSTEKEIRSSGPGDTKHVIMSIPGEYNPDTCGDSGSGDRLFVMVRESSASNYEAAGTAISRLGVMQEAARTGTPVVDIVEVALKGEQMDSRDHDESILIRFRGDAGDNIRAQIRTFNVGESIISEPVRDRGGSSPFVFDEELRAIRDIVFRIDDDDLREPLKPDTIYQYLISTKNDANFDDSTSIVGYLVTKPTENPITIQTPEQQSVNETGKVNYRLPVQNPDGHRISWSVVGEKRGNERVDGSGHFIWDTREADGSDTPYKFNIQAEAAGDTIRRALFVQVNDTNVPPVWHLETNYTFFSEVTRDITLDATDGDIPEQTLTYSFVGGNLGATISGNMLTWRPTLAQAGDRTLTIRATDDYMPPLSADITLYFEVKQGVDPSAPFETHNTTEDTPIVITPMISDEDGTVRITYASDGTFGRTMFDNTTITYTPDKDRNGQDMVNYTVTDDDGLTANGVLTIGVEPVRDVPEFVDLTSEFIPRGQHLTFLVTAEAADSDVLEYSLVSPEDSTARESTARLHDNRFDWTPNKFTVAGSRGFSAQFGVTVTDGQESLTETIFIVVTDASGSGRLGPGRSSITNDIYVEFAEDTSHNITLAQLIVNDIYQSGAYPIPSVTFSNEKNVTVTGNQTYTIESDENFAGVTTFEYTADATGARAATVIVNVTNVPDPVVLDEIGAITIREEAPWGIDIAATDPDREDELTFNVLDMPDGMTFSNNRLEWEPTEAQGPGEYMINVTVTDGMHTDYEEVTITVNEVNLPPVFDENIPTDHAVRINNTFTLQLNVTDPDIPRQSVTLSILNAHGSNTDYNISPTNELTWTPTEAVVNTIIIQANDGGGGTSNLVLTVTAATIAAAIDTADTNGREPLVIPVLDNDEPADARIAGVSQNLTLAGGRYLGDVIHNTTHVTYTPNEAAKLVRDGTSGSVQYTIDSPTENGTSSADITITFDSGRVVDAVDDSRETRQNIPILINILENDVYGLDPQSNLTIADADRGFARSTETTGLIRYTPPLGFSGQDMFTYTITDDIAGASDTATVFINVTRNEPPQARNFTISVPAGESRTVDLGDEGHISDESDALASLRLSFEQPSQGSVTGSGRTITYTADSNATDQDSFTYAITDPSHESDNATVTVFINANPTAANFSISANASQTVQIDLLEAGHINDTEGTDGLTVEITQNPRQGIASVVDNTTISYRPYGEADDTDTFGYTVFDERGASASATVTVEITPVNLTAVNDRLTVSPNGSTTLDVLENDIISPDGTEVIVRVLRLPQGGDGVVSDNMIIYMPEPGTTSDTLTYVIRSDQAGSNIATVTITVGDTGTPDPVDPEPPDPMEPEPPGATSVPPVLRDISNMTIQTGDTLGFFVNVSGGGGQNQTISYGFDGTVPVGATINATGYFSWMPLENQTGDHPINITVSDGQNRSDSKTFTVTVNATATEPEPGRPNPNLLVPDILINAELHFPSAVTPAVADPAGGNVTITGVTGATLGVLDTSMLPQISYTPNQTGIDILTYMVSDERGGTANGTISIFINPDGNARPVLEHIYNIGGRVGVDLNFTATADDSDATPFTFDIANVPDGASITAGGDFSWRPTPSQNGTHTVTFIVHDDSGGADWQHVLVTILRADETNLPPVPQDIDAGVVLGGGRGFQPDIDDPENDVTEIVRVYDSSLGDVDRSFTSQGIIVYVAGVLGGDEVVYTVSDGRGGFANGTLSITVEEPANVRPLIDFVGDKSVNAGDELTFTVDADDLDGFVINFGLEGETQGPSMSPQGVFSWTPTANDVGRHEFTILVFDDAGDNSTVSIVVTVRPEDFENSPPVAPDVVIMTPQDVLSIVRPTLTDPDEGDPVRISEIGDTTKGRILTGFLRAGIIIYLPNQGETGTETIPYTIADSSDGNDTAAINVFISARGNTDPILGSIYFRNINAGDPLGFDLEADDPDGDAISYLPVGAPDGIEISSEGRLGWTPTAADVGNHTFAVIAYDDRGGADSKSAVIRVLPAGTANQAPNAPDSSVTVAPGGSVVITPAISDPDGDRVVIHDAVASGTGVVIPSEDSINYIHIATTPTETITYTVTDARGATSTGTITVTVQ